MKGYGECEDGRQVNFMTAVVSVRPWSLVEFIIALDHSILAFIFVDVVSLFAELGILSPILAWPGNRSRQLSVGDRENNKLPEQTV